MDYVPEDAFSSVDPCALMRYSNTCQKPIVWVVVCFCTKLLLCVWLSGKDVLIPSGTLQKQPFSILFPLDKASMCFGLKYVGVCFYSKTIYVIHVYLSVFHVLFSCFFCNWLIGLLYI